jgi:hypothetical protein
VKLPGWTTAGHACRCSTMSTTSLDASFILIESNTSNADTQQAAKAINEVSSQISRNRVHNLRISYGIHQPLAVHSSQNVSCHPGLTHSYAHDWSNRGTGGSIKIDGRNLVDAYGRVCNLRGVNMSGSSKMFVALSSPLNTARTPYRPTDHDHENFPGDHASVTFVGRPFPLEQAHEHFSRLRRWGLTFSTCP